MLYSEYKFLRIERRANGVLLITMNRPEVLNACDPSGHDELGRIWIDFDRDPDSKVAIITGEGKGFCAGGDLGKSEAGDVDAVQAIMKHDVAVAHNMINLKKPVISAINGVAVGAGLAVALLADIPIASERAKLIDGHAKIGVVAGDHAAMIWPLLCGIARSKYHLLLCEPISGKEAAEMGMVSRCVPPEMLMPTALQVAEKLANGSQWAIRGTKQVMNQWLKQHMAIFDHSVALEMLSFFLPDAKEGIEAFLQKRSVNFPSARRGG